MIKKGTNLTHFLIHQEAKKSLSTLLLKLADISIKISALTVKGALTDITNKLTSQNVQGETQIQLDVSANDIFKEELTQCDLVAGLASEEMDDVCNLRQAEYLVLFDPVDGSSNVEINVTVGSIFSVLKAPESRVPVVADYLQAGQHQVAAGYTLYGPATMMVITIGKGTHGFTLDLDTKSFVLTHPNMRVAEITSEYAINASNERFWEPPLKLYISECNAGESGERKRNFNMRWVASLVVEVHRILLRGGIYLYPRDSRMPLNAGRLRLMYELNPMSFLVEQAGGKSSNGVVRVMDIIPTQVHERAPILIGTTQEVTLMEQYTKTYNSSDA
jgi:fructose-1,6-bisphosphatase I/sedoheptulose-1,7-bisphosphatase/fructose-1,6-bisphosphatase I